MSFRGRLESLERLGKRCGLEDWCTSCGGVSPEGATLVALPPGESLPSCPECGLELDQTGRPLGRPGPDGHSAVKILILDPDPASLLHADGALEDVSGPPDVIGQGHGLRATPHV